MAKDEHGGGDRRKERLAQKLRENLRRRKAQMRERKDVGMEPQADTGRTGSDTEKGASQD